MAQYLFKAYLSPRKMSESEFGDFEEIKEETEETNSQDLQQEQQAPSRIRMPRQGQLLGVVIQRLGGKRMSIKASDGKIRNCRVPGRFSRKFWLRPGHAVLIEPWPDDDDKGDVVYHFRKGERVQLKKKGMLDGLEEEF
jgi:translation initiation factor 1A